jgi:predicted SnoaL-like aldol condensation-catalyzing enzyme
MKTLFNSGVALLVLSSVLLFGACTSGNSLAQLQAKIDSLQGQLTIKDQATAQEAANKKLVTDFYQAVFGDKDVTAIDKYLAENYIQHNPVLGDGRETLKQALTAWYKGMPKEKIDIHHIAADGDLVFIHTKSTENGKAVSIIDIFRIEHNQLVEHWDVIQPVPDKSSNAHPMF